MASERVESVRAKSLALSAKVRRRAFLILSRESSEETAGGKEVYALSNGLIDDLTPVSFGSE